MASEQLALLSFGRGSVVAALFALDAGQAVLEFVDGLGGAQTGGRALLVMQRPGRPHLGLFQIVALPFAILGQFYVWAGVWAGNSRQPALPERRGFVPTFLAFEEPTQRVEDFGQRVRIVGCACGNQTFQRMGKSLLRALLSAHLGVNTTHRRQI